MVYTVYGYHFSPAGGTAAAGELCVAVVMFRAEINACEEKIKNPLAKTLTNKPLQHNVHSFYCEWYCIKTAAKKKQNPSLPITCDIIWGKNKSCLVRL